MLQPLVRLGFNIATCDVTLEVAERLHVVDLIEIKQIHKSVASGKTGNKPEMFTKHVAHVSQGLHSLVIRQQLFWLPHLPCLKHLEVRRVVRSTLTGLTLWKVNTVMLSLAVAQTA